MPHRRSSGAKVTRLRRLRWTNFSYVSFPLSEPKQVPRVPDIPPKKTT